MGFNIAVIQSNERPEGFIYSLRSSPTAFWRGLLVSWFVCGEAANESDEFFFFSPWENVYVQGFSC